MRKRRVWTGGYRGKNGLCLFCGEWVWIWQHLKKRQCKSWTPAEHGAYRSARRFYGRVRFKLLGDEGERRAGRGRAAREGE